MDTKDKIRSYLTAKVAQLSADTIAARRALGGKKDG